MCDLCRRAVIKGAGALQVQAADSRAFDQSETSKLALPADLTVAGHLLLPVTVFVISFLSIEFSHISNFITTIWPSNALILFALLRHAPSPRNYGSILIGGACAIGLANLAAGNSPALCAIFSATNTVEVVTAWALLSIFRIGISNLNSFRNLLFFIVIGGGVAPIGSDALGAMAVESWHRIPWHAVWRNSYPAHALGMIVVAPFLISITSEEWHALRIKDRRGEAAAIFALVIAVAICAAYFRSILFIFVPATLLATLRFGLIGATIAIFAMALIFSGFVVMGIGLPLITQTELSSRILALQVLIAVTSLWVLPTAALLMERDRLFDALSLANSQLEIESERKSHMVVGLQRHLSTAEERERLRLSYELHDQAGQSLIGAILELNEIDPLVYGPARERLHLVRKRMEEMGKTLHRIAWELRPASIDELGLRKALASYIDDWGEQCGTDVDLHCDDPSLDEVPNEISSAVFRVVQEGLTNVVKHAQHPANVSVVIRRVNTMLQVIIEDNGCGFDVATINPKVGGYRGLGLEGMRERLLLIGGTLEIESAIGTGTAIFARIPLHDQRASA
jgi:signal transduction histidine kinase